MAVAAGLLRPEAGEARIGTLRPAPGTTSAASTPGVAHSGLRPPVPVFLLGKGRFRGFDVPIGPGQGELVDINNRGGIVGGYQVAAVPDGIQGFLRDRRGRFSRIDVPGPDGLGRARIRAAPQAGWADHPYTRPRRGNEAAGGVCTRRGASGTVSSPSLMSSAIVPRDHHRSLVVLVQLGRADRTRPRARCSGGCDHQRLPTARRRATGARTRSRRPTVTATSRMAIHPACRARQAREAARQAPVAATR